MSKIFTGGEESSGGEAVTAMPRFRGGRGIGPATTRRRYCGDIAMGLLLSPPRHVSMAIADEHSIGAFTCLHLEAFFASSRQVDPSPLVTMLHYS